jgi:Membrane-bound lysozyme-inhibitor of c-type lysozyme
MAEVYKDAVRAMENIDTGSAVAVGELKASQHGWISGRNDCWKAEDKRQCTADSYDRRLAFLQARYFLVEGGEPVFYICSGNTADEIVATFIPTDPPSVRLERGDSVEIGILSRSGSGSRYEAQFGVYFWIKGHEARVAWPQEIEFTCTVR